MITSLTKHIPNVSIPSEGSKFILAPSILFIVVPGKLHHLKTQNKQVEMWEITSSETFIVSLLYFNMEKQDIRMQMSLKPSSADVHRSSSMIENVGFLRIRRQNLAQWSMDKCSGGLETFQEEIWGCYEWQGKNNKEFNHVPQGLFIPAGSNRLS